MNPPIFIIMKKQAKRISRAKAKIKIPNALTRKTIEDARKGSGLKESITDIKAFMDSL